MASVKKAQSFEDGMIRLDALADEMEKGDLPLEKLMSLYEEGAALAAELTQKLEVSQARLLEIKKGAGGKPVASPAAVQEQTSLLEEREP